MSLETSGLVFLGLKPGFEDIQKKEGNSNKEANGKILIKTKGNDIFSK